jgi:hypothetical protein
MAYELRVDWAPPLRAVQLVQDRNWRWWHHDGTPPDLLRRDRPDLATHLLRLLSEDCPPTVRHVRTLAPRPRGAPRLGHTWLRTRATTLELRLDHDQVGLAAISP